MRGSFVANTCWLAFCSGKYLREAGRLIPNPGREISEFSFGYRDKTRCFDDSLGLPASVELYADSALTRKSVRDPRVTRTTDPAYIELLLDPGSPVLDGLLQVRYQVRASTNVLGWSVPLEFDLALYSRQPSEREPVARAKGLVTSISGLAAPPEPLLSTGAPAFIYDFRFRHPQRLVDAITYTTTNGNIPSTSDPALGETFRRAALAAPMSPVARATYQRYGIYGLFLLAMGIPAIIAIWRKITPSKGMPI